MATSKRKGAAAAVAVAAINMALLAQIAEATKANSFVHTSEADHAPLLAEGLVEVNANIKDEAGNVATRATPAGIERVSQRATDEKPSAQPEGNSTMQAAEQTAAPAAAPAAAKPSFVIETGIAIPTAKRGVGGGVYPFDTMEPGQSFFVAATEDKPNPAKSLASTVSSATKRYADSDKRKFVVRSVDETAQGRGPGARVWRTS